jgi:ethanolamine utilization protein EutP (predicted NTPase)
MHTALAESKRKKINVVTDADVASKQTDSARQRLREIPAA